jgi:hypothetical protein
LRAGVEAVARVVFLATALRTGVVAFLRAGAFATAGFAGSSAAILRGRPRLATGTVGLAAGSAGGRASGCSAATSGNGTLRGRPRRFRERFGLILGLGYGGRRFAGRRSLRGSRRRRSGRRQSALLDLDRFELELRGL